jgi:hypothetical protein
MPSGRVCTFRFALTGSQEITTVGVRSEKNDLNGVELTAENRN